MKQRLPLEDIRILDAGAALAVPLATRFLADMGAQVIKVESCQRPEVGRVITYPDATPGEQPWEKGGFYHEANRNKLGVTLNLNAESGQAVFRRLVEASDIVAENFSPRVMKNWGLDYQVLCRLKPDLIYLSSTGYGHSGPWRDYKAYGMTLAPTSGLSHYTGYREGPPMRNVISYTDSPAALINAFAMLCALEYRGQTGCGQWIDSSQYEIGASLTVEGLLELAYHGYEPSRQGNDDPVLAPHGVYPCAGNDEWIAIAVEDDAQWATLANVMDLTALAQDSRFATIPARWHHRRQLDQIVAEWTVARSKTEAQATLQAAGVPAGAVNNVRDLFLSDQLRERGFFERVVHPNSVPDLGTRVYPGSLWRTARFPGPFIRRPAPRLGEHNREVLSDLLGLSTEELVDLEASGVVGTVPTLLSEAGSGRHLSLDEMQRQGMIMDFVPSYHETLAGIGRESAQED